ncbi:protein FAR1-RELATED SEQUENCE 7-like [Mercurialis annua]|uniref:protein FAR1-RELATED SEQUENCE 7-like n=1 Tax=Mercurialis annua TaxID=3986 RepID=UPI00215DE6ED|nr:protein FAR1-RELATED SEQUENCE 7-like [Mercurialis annua]
MDSERSTDISGEVPNNSVDSSSRIGNDGRVKESNAEAVSQPELENRSNGDEAVSQPELENGSNVDEAVSQPEPPSDEPYVGQEFDSHSAALEFYCKYAMRMGFITRINRTSQLDGVVVSKTLVCSREGFQRPNSRNDTAYVRSPKARGSIRVGCKARVSFKKKQSSGKWFISNLIKDHTHPLNDSVFQKGRISQVPSDDRRIRELTQELTTERKRSASLREFINLLFNHIEEHTQGLSEKVQYIVDKVNKIESESKDPKRLNLNLNSR